MAMLNIISVLIGVVTLVLGLVAFVPLLGWLNWLVIPIGVVGAAVGALSSSNGGRNLNLILIVIFAGRHRHEIRPGEFPDIRTAEGPGGRAPSPHLSRSLSA